MTDRQKDVHEWRKGHLVDNPKIDFWLCMRCGRVSPGPTDNEALVPPATGCGVAQECASCGRVGELPPVAVAVTVPVRTVGGSALETPGVYPVCAACRRAVAHAEHSR